MSEEEQQAEITDQRIAKVIDLIDYSFDQPADFNRLARAVNLSASRLRHLFKSQVGVSYKQYLRRVRMKKAARLLESGFLKVKEISARVGASDVSHFVRDFEKEHGMSPAKYRENFLEEKMKKLQIISKIAKTANE